MRVLVVTNPFADYQAGDIITDLGLVADLLAGEHAGHVVRAEHPDPAKPVKPTLTEEK